MTAEDLDAQMDDYFGGKDGASDEPGKAPTAAQPHDSVPTTNPPETAGLGAPAAAPGAMDEDIDMIE